MSTLIFRMGGRRALLSKTQSYYIIVQITIGLFSKLTFVLKLETAFCSRLIHFRNRLVIMLHNCLFKSIFPRIEKTSGLLDLESTTEAVQKVPFRVASEARPVLGSIRRPVAISHPLSLLHSFAESRQINVPIRN